MKTLTLTVFIILINIKLFAPNLPEEQIENLLLDYLRQQEKQNLYEEMLDFTRRMEGLRLKQYNCPAGLKTIGYGHILKGNENYQHITKEQADSLLRIDFDYAFNFTPKTLIYNKRLAIAHFIFNCGIGTYNRSKLKKAIDQNKPINIILNYCYYKKNGEYVRSNWLYKARKFEFEFSSREIKYL